ESFLTPLIESFPPPEFIILKKTIVGGSIFRQQRGSVYIQQRQLMNKTLTKVRCRKIIPLFLKMIQDLKQSPFKSLVALGKTLDSWKEEIACMWRFSKSNGITEGFHRKMKLIQRRAYGFRNFENYRLRVRVLCA
ncbi:transposase, partial [Legionella pneumophila serogroup 10]